MQEEMQSLNNLVKEIEEERRVLRIKIHNMTKKIRILCRVCPPRDREIKNPGIVIKKHNIQIV